jgi:hypothetical protein
MLAEDLMHASFIIRSLTIGNPAPVHPPIIQQVLIAFITFLITFRCNYAYGRVSRFVCAKY